MCRHLVDMRQGRNPRTVSVGELDVGLVAVGQEISVRAATHEDDDIELVVVARVEAEM